MTLHGSASRPFWLCELFKEKIKYLFLTRVRIYTPVLNKNCECSATVFATELINQAEAGREEEEEFCSAFIQRPTKNAFSTKAPLFSTAPYHQYAACLP